MLVGLSTHAPVSLPCHSAFMPLFWEGAGVRRVPQTHQARQPKILHVVPGPAMHGFAWPFSCRSVSRRQTIRKPFAAVPSASICRSLVCVNFRLAQSLILFMFGACHPHLPQRSGFTVQLGFLPCSRTGLLPELVRQSTKRALALRCRLLASGGGHMLSLR